MPNFIKKQPVLFLILTGIVAYVPFLGAVHLFDWDEVNFAESAREMLVTGNFFRVQIDFVPFWEKPPFFFWLQAFAMKLFGVSEFAARLPNAVFGVISLVSLYYWGSKLKDNRFGLIWAVAFGSSLLPFLYFKSGIIDPVFNYFIFAGWIQLLFYHQFKQLKHAILAATFIGIAIITKGPVAVLLTALSWAIVFVWQKGKLPFKKAHIAAYAVIAAAISLLWFGPETIINGPAFLTEFIDYQIRLFATADAGHGQPFYYHFVVVLFGCFPMSFIALPQFYKHQNTSLEKRFMLTLFWVVLILFSIVKTKIVHYSSLSYFPLSFLAALQLEQLWDSKSALPARLKNAMFGFGILLALVLLAFPILLLNAEVLSPLMKDAFGVAALATKINVEPLSFLPGILLLFGLMLYFKTSNKQPIKALGYLAGSLVISLWLYLPLVTPKIEAFSQGPAIEFYQSLQGQDVYVKPYKFKSYAHLFYFKKPAATALPSFDYYWLIDGEVDKPVYMVAKVGKTLDNPNFEIIGKSGGYVFYKRSLK